MKGLGPGIRVGGFAVKFSHTRFYCEIRPLGGPDPGRLDGNGNWMHFRYTGNITQATTSSMNPIDADYAPPKIDVEFDADGVVILPYCGNVEIVGGIGDYLVNISQAERIGHGSEQGLNPTASVGYQPTLKSLITKVDARLTVPGWHTRIWGYNNSVLITETVTGNPLQTSNVEPGTRVLPGTVFTTAVSTMVVTAWIG